MKTLLFWISKFMTPWVRLPVCAFKSSQLNGTNVQFSLALRSDLSGTDVRVTSIEPGMVETEFMLVRMGGDQAASDALYRGVTPMTGDDIAATMLWVAELPPHLNINRIELMPINQSFAGFQVARTS